MAEANLNLSIQPRVKIQGGQKSEETSQFVKYVFFKIDRKWKQTPPRLREQASSELLHILSGFSEKLTLRTYSLLGIRADADFMLWLISERLEDFQDITKLLLSTPLGSYLETRYSYLALTRRSEYLGSHRHEGEEGPSIPAAPSDRKYLFVYPLTKKREWYKLPFEERRRMMMDHFRVGHKYPSVQIHTSYSFGLDDQEFLLAFETDSPRDFLELVMELRRTAASQFTHSETPIFTCIRVKPEELLDQIIV